MRTLLTSTVLLTLALAPLRDDVAAQGRGGAQGGGRGAAQGGPAGAATPTARQMAPVDLTGTWVSVVSEDWAWRMFTPPKGDYASVPLNPAGRKAADAWTPDQDGSCSAYGAAALLRNPGRVRISWQDDSTLKIETDAGAQTRLLRFGPVPNVMPVVVSSAPAPATSSSTSAAASSGPRTLQGRSVAAWQTQGVAVSSGAEGGATTSRPTGRPWASLKVVTTEMQAAWLRKNGVPYSEKAVLTEHFDHFVDGVGPGASEWFTVSTMVEDPTYLNMPFIISSNFKKEPDGSKWAPTSCRAN
jgi:hypothetical protein